MLEFREAVLNPKTNMQSLNNIFLAINDSVAEITAITDLYKGKEKRKLCWLGRKK